MNSSVTRAGTPKTIQTRRRRSSVDAVDVLVFLIPCLQLIRIHVIGVLNGSDVMMLAIFFYLACRGKLRIATPVGRWSLILCSLWLASQCVTDIVRHTAFADYARGWSNIGFTFASLAVLWTLLYGRPRRLEIYGWGLVVGGVLFAVINPNELTVAGAPGDAWKFGFAFPVTLGVFLLASRKECRGPWPVALAVMIGVVNIGEGSRGEGGFCMAAALYLVITGFLRRKGAESSTLKAGTAVVLAASLILSIAGVVWGYGRAASSGILGDDAREKYEEQSGGQYGLLLGGRTEMLSSIPAIYDSPILGHGSWAKDPLYMILQNQALARLGYTWVWDVSNEDLQEGLIPTHSYIFGAWVDGGILGAVFWGWVFVLTARALLRVYPATAVLLPAVAFVAFSLLWDILFSPYGTPGRISFPYAIVVMMTCVDMAFRKTICVPASKTKRTIRTALTPRPQH
jgi:hypothetical protein